MNRSAFTLIEALVAIVLVAVVLPLAMSGVTGSLRGAERSRNQDTARRIAESRLARLVADGSWSGSVSAGDCTAADDGDDAVGYRWQMSVATWRDLAVQELRLSVGRGASDAPGSVTLTTLVVEAGITP